VDNIGKIGASSTITSAQVDDDNDMFGDEFEVKKPASSSASTKKVTFAKEEEKQEEKSILDGSEQVMWEFKWEDTPTAKIYGPHSSSEMSAWTSGDYFKDGVWVRKVSSTSDSGNFYTSKRIDFDLYC
jgi:CD2 antigen cytoplasmic tail-binding protein 2